MSKTISYQPRVSPEISLDLKSSRPVTPDGLHILRDCETLILRQHMDVDINAGCGTSNTYTVYDGETDKKLLYVVEEPNCCCRWFCGPHRKFAIRCYNNTDEEVLFLERRGCRCDWCCCIDCFLCNHKLYVMDGRGQEFGYVKQKFSITNPKFIVYNMENEVIGQIKGPCCPCRCCTEISFMIRDKTGENAIGEINKKWGGERPDRVNVDHEYLELTFPASMTPTDKALLLGATFLIEFMYFEMS